MHPQRTTVKPAIAFVYSDGGRREAGFRGDTRDCVVRAIAIATPLPYERAYKLVNAAAKLERPRSVKRSAARTGVHKRTTRAILADLGWEWHSCMQIGTGCQVHLRSDELPPGRIIVSLSHHLAAVVDGVLHDTFDGSRDGTRCVYGYWQRPPWDERLGQKRRSAPTREG